MIRVMIVDDEYLIRQLVMNSADWNALGFEIVGEAEDGEQALERIEELKPELMIIDINIPFINGIELSQIIRRRHRHIQIIILTGYGEFEYAKQAIKAGVLSYIVKPIRPEEFEQALLSAKERIISEANRNKYISLLEREARSGREKGREAFLCSVVREGMEAGEIAKGFDHYGISILGEDIAVIAIEIDRLIEAYGFIQGKRQAL